MADNLQLKLLDFKGSLSKIRKISLKNFNVESCGFLTKNDAFSCKNISKSPKNSYIIDPLDFFKNQEFVAVWHSHPFQSSVPSDFDIDQSCESGFPFLIYGIGSDDFSFFCPKSFNLFYFSLEKV